MDKFHNYQPSDSPVDFHIRRGQLIYGGGWQGPEVPESYMTTFKSIFEVDNNGKIFCIPVLCHSQGLEIVPLGEVNIFELRIDH